MGRQYSSRAGPYCQGFFMKPHVAFTRYKLSHVLGDYLLTDPGYHPYYGRNFFQLIKYAKVRPFFSL